MTTDTFLSVCPVCRQGPLSTQKSQFYCPVCGFTVKQQLLFGVKPLDKYRVIAIGSEYGLAQRGLVGQLFPAAEVEMFAENVYSDAHLAEIAAGDLTHLTMPRSTLAQIILEQLRETCYVQLRGMRRAHGPTFEAGSQYLPQGAVPAAGLTWLDEGNLFLTNGRIVFPSNTFTFIRMDRKLIGLKAFDNGVVVQRKGEEFATYFVGCRPHQAALIAAYIQGQSPALKKVATAVTNPPAD